VTVLAWSTNKLKRVARSSLAAEVQALSNAEDELHLVRAAWAEFNGKNVDLDHPDETVKTVKGTVVIDAKSIYDTLVSENQPLQLQEKRTALELLAYLHNTEANGTQTRWVHGGANLADSFTKLNAANLIREFMLNSQWSVVQDKEQISGKKRKAQGLDKFDNNTSRLDQEELAEFIEFRTAAKGRLTEIYPEWFEDADELGYDEDF